MKNILYYIPDPEKQKKIQDLCGKMGLSAEAIRTDQINMPVRALAGIGMVNRPGKTAAEAAKTKAPLFFSMPELILFNGLDSGGLDRFLDAYKAAGISSVSLKAILTLWNLDWTPYEFALELKKEHDAVCGKR